MKTIVRPRSRWRSRSRLRICAWIETSSAETGSSAMIELRLERERARDADALALPARELVREAVVVLGVQPDPLHQLLHAPLRRAVAVVVEPVDPERLGDDRADVLRGFSDEYGSWKIICISRRSGLSSRRDDVRDVAAAIRRSCRSWARAAGVIEPRGRALAAARLADDARASRPRSMSNETPSTACTVPICSLEDDPARDREVLDEVAHLDERLAHGSAPRSLARARPRGSLPCCAARPRSSAASARRAGTRPHGADRPARARAPGRPRGGASRTYGQRGWKRAAARQVDQARRPAGDRHELARRARLSSRGIEPSSPTCTGARAARTASRRRRALDDAAGVHHRHVVGRLGDHAEVVGDHHDGRVELVLEAADQLEDLRLHRHVERGRRLVGDQQLRLVRERHRDHRALAHAARELVRIGCRRAPTAPGSRPCREARSRGRARACLRDLAVRPDRLDELRSRPCRTGAATTAGPGRSSRCRCRAASASRRRSSVEQVAPLEQDLAR